jgi:hypothetical protein
VEGSARSLIPRFDVKQRVYYGNTSMESEISLLMANQTLVGNQRFLGRSDLQRLLSSQLGVTREIHI